MAQESAGAPSSQGHSTAPRRVRLPGFAPEEPIGLGDVVKRATSVAGIKPCAGCARRARRLNSWLVLSRRSDRA